MSECVTQGFELEDVTVEEVQEHGDGWLVTVPVGPRAPVRGVARTGGIATGGGRGDSLWLMPG